MSNVDPVTGQPETALTRLDAIRRALQRQLRRKGTLIERAALDRAALMSLRAEIAARDPRADSNTIVRLDNAARRARQDFERVCKINHTKPQRDMRDINRELAHVR